jgi:hypothetical protein
MRALIEHPALQTDVSASANAMTDTHLVDDNQPEDAQGVEKV